MKKQNENINSVLIILLVGIISLYEVIMFMRDHRHADDNSVYYRYFPFQYITTDVVYNRSTYYIIIIII